MTDFIVLVQLVDLGEVANSYGSAASCPLQNTACRQYCGLRGRCVGGLHHPRCECNPGWTGSGCSTPTVPARFKVSSYLKVALSFSPDPWTVHVQVRLRLRGARSGLVLQLAARHRAAALTLHVRLYTHLYTPFTYNVSLSSSLMLPSASLPPLLSVSLVCHANP